MTTRTKPLRPGRTEKQVTQEVLEALRMFGLEPVRQNVGGGVNPSGRYVAFGEPGQADWKAELPDGRTLFIELKREGFDPAKLRGEKQAHFARQLEKLRHENERGNVAFWTDNAVLITKVLPIILAGGRVTEDVDGRLVVEPRGGE